MIDVSRCTKHERGVLIAALAQYRARQDRRARIATTPRDHAEPNANAFVASDLLRQVNDR